MKTLVFCGKGDKRPYTYSLIKTLALIGKTLVQTDDVAYRRLYNGIENTGSVHDVDIQICNDLKAEVDLLNPGDDEEDGGYDIRLIITDQENPVLDADKVVYCLGINRDYMGTKFTAIQDDDPEAVGTIIALTSVDKKAWAKKNITVFDWTSDRMEYVYKCEELHDLYPSKDKAMNIFLCNTFAPVLGVRHKEYMKAAARKLK